MEWRAVFRLSSFISNSKCGFIQNIYGEKLSDDLINLTRNLTNKRKEYFTAALNIPLENINYENLHVFSPDDTDDSQIEQVYLRSLICIPLNRL